MMDYRYGLPWNQERGERKRLLAAAVFVMRLFLSLYHVFRSRRTNSGEVGGGPEG